jgi:hypothetical protein
MFFESLVERALEHMEMAQKTVIYMACFHLLRCYDESSRGQNARVTSTSLAEDVLNDCRQDLLLLLGLIANILGSCGLTENGVDTNRALMALDQGERGDARLFSAVVVVLTGLNVVLPRLSPTLLQVFFGCET